MRRNLLSIILAALMLFVGAGAAMAHEEAGKETEATPEEAGNSALASVDYMSQYVSRGQVLSRSQVIQPSIDLDYHSFDVNLWANYDTHARELNETDFTLKYTYTIEGLTMSAGYSYLGAVGANTEEAFVSASYDTILTPTITYYQDLRLGEGGGFAVFDLNQQSPELWRGITMGGGASVGYNFRNVLMGLNENGKKFSGFYNGEVSINLNIPVTKDIAIVPLIAYDFPLSGDAKYAIEEARRAIGDSSNSSVLWGGVTVSVGF